MGILPHVLDPVASALASNPLYASSVSALIAFDAAEETFPSYLHLIGFWGISSSLGDFLRSHSAFLLSEDSGGLSEGDIHLPLNHVSLYASVIAAVIVILGGLAWCLLGVSLPFAVSFSLFLMISSAPFVLPLAEAVPLWMTSLLLEKSKILLKSLLAAEALSSIDMLVVGKPDIFTKGEPIITDLVPEGITLPAFLSLAAAAESGSRHPIAKAISERAIRARAKYGRIAAFNESPGEGVEALMNGAPIRVGLRPWIKSQGVRISANLLTKDDQLAEKGKTILYVSNGRNAKGIIAYEYELLEDAKKIADELSADGVATLLMAGEGPRTAKALAKKLGNLDFRHSIKAEDLIKEVQLLQAQGKNVGIFARLSEENPAALQADCAIFPAEDGTKKSDAPVISGGDIVVTPEDGDSKTEAPVRGIVIRRFSDLPFARRNLKRLLFMARQNALFAFLGAVLILPASSGLLVAVGGTFPSPWMTLLSSLPGIFAIIWNAFSMRREFTSAVGADKEALA